jgi:hypothetical protein
VHVNQVREGLNAIYAEYAAEIVAIKQGTAALARVLQEESSARMKRKLWLFAVGGLGLGCAVASTIAVLVGRLG